ncbi:MAG: phospho-N-acetylmuramoyl-pentapeptide-transferase [Candidatus Woesebacteria bacterium]|nr:phospho-N-acetylmuramoyl-pentapeptide-transferase [Candidatus Woesebacteria bacterium]
MQNFLPLALGLILFSFLTTSILVVPFIDFLYKIKFTRKAEAPKSGKVPLFDKLHDIKAGTPVGGGLLIIFVVTTLFAIIFPLSSYMGVFIQTAYNLRIELFVIFFTFISFGLLGLLDDYKKMLGKPTKGVLGLAFGLSRRQKFLAQWILAGFISFIIYKILGIHILHIPIINITLDIGFWYVPFSAFVIVSFTNAFNITDGLDGLASGLLMICLMAFGVIAASGLDTPLSLFIALWIGALIAFLYFNSWPARIWLGDSGALSFGATLAVIGLLTGSIVALIVIGGIFVIEILSSAIQILGWKFLNRPIFKLAPIHHTFLAIGWEEPKIVMRAWLAGIILAIFGLWLATI